jgi:hypothetical protein
MRPRVIPQRLPFDPPHVAAMSPVARRTWILAYVSREIITMKSMGVSRSEIMAKVRRDFTDVLPMPDAECAEYMAHAERCYNLLSTMFPPGTTNPNPTDTP